MIMRRHASAYAAVGMTRAAGGKIQTRKAGRGRGVVFVHVRRIVRATPGRASVARRIEPASRGATLVTEGVLFVTRCVPFVTGPVPRVRRGIPFATRGLLDETTPGLVVTGSFPLVTRSLPLVSRRSVKATATRLVRGRTPSRRAGASCEVEGVP